MAVFARLQSFFTTKKKVTRKTVAQYQHDVLVRSGREQFEYLLQKKIRIPVVLL